MVRSGFGSTSLGAWFCGVAEETLLVPETSGLVLLSGGRLGELGDDDEEEEELGVISLLEFDLMM